MKIYMAISIEEGMNSMHSGAYHRRSNLFPFSSLEAAKAYCEREWNKGVSNYSLEWKEAELKKDSPLISYHTGRVQGYTEYAIEEYEVRNE